MFLLSEHKKDCEINVCYVQSWYFKSRSWPRRCLEVLERLFIRDNQRHLTHTVTSLFSPSGSPTTRPSAELLSYLIECVCEWRSLCVFRAVCVCVCVCVSVRACLTPFSANTMLRVVMYISCFVGPRRTSSFSSHQTFILQKRIYISRDPAQPNLLGASTSPSPSRYHSRRMFHVLVCLFSSRPSPPPPNTPTFLF